MTRFGFTGSSVYDAEIQRRSSTRAIAKAWKFAFLSLWNRSDQTNTPHAYGQERDGFVLRVALSELQM